MYAIFKSGGKQYQAEPGKVIKLEKLPGSVGDNVLMDQVLLVADGDQVEVGTPVLRDTAVHGRIMEQNRYRKVLIFKHKRRKGYRKMQGHRQPYTAVLVQSIGRPGLESPQAVPETESRESSE
ncbi:MAG: 50S ribosomal protein L21 [Syntrophobacteraceae bacterium]